MDKVDDVKKMLDGLMSKDEEQVGGSLPSVFRYESFQSGEAAEKIEEFVGEQAREDALWRERSLFTAGCKTVSSRTVINNKEVEEEARKKRSEEMKELGNNSFRTGKFQEAEEYYTSALLQYDQVTSPYPSPFPSC